MDPGRSELCMSFELLDVQDSDVGRSPARTVLARIAQRRSHRGARPTVFRTSRGKKPPHDELSIGTACRRTHEPFSFSDSIECKQIVRAPGEGALKRAASLQS